ncbi:hypothetical protein EV122DRAFT_282766 [Schizophyllum commune]
MRRENDERIAGLTEEERMEGIQEVVSTFGPDIQDFMRTIRENRERRQSRSGASPSSSTEKVDDAVELLPHKPVSSKPEPAISMDTAAADRKDAYDAEPQPSVPLTSEEVVVTRPSSLTALPSPALSRSNTRLSSRADRRLRFAAVQPKDVHDYESAPLSPKRPLLALPPPEAGDDDAVSLGKSKSLPSSPTLAHSPLASSSSHAPESSGSVTPAASSSQAQSTGDLEEGTPEYIRRRFFPNVATGRSQLCLDGVAASRRPLRPKLHFDLHGASIPHNVSSQLPTHLGMHHHAEGEHAGYMIDDVFLLCLSTVPRSARRCSACSRVSPCVSRRPNAGRWTASRSSAGVRRKFVRGRSALSERGSVGARAVELVWAAIVGWDVSAVQVDGVELEAPGDTSIASLPIDCKTMKVSDVERPLQTVRTLPRAYHRSELPAPEGAASLAGASYMQGLDPTRSSSSPVSAKLALGAA